MQLDAPLLERFVIRVTRSEDRLTHELNELLLGLALGLPLAVALFRATGPAMNVAFAFYVAYLLDVSLSPLALGAGIAVASIASRP